MKIKVSEATNIQLDWMVARLQGVELYPLSMYKVCVPVDDSADFYGPTTDWAQAGPIIEREGISVVKLEHEYGVDSKGYTTSERIPVFGAVIGEYFDTDMQRSSYGESYGEIYYIGTELVTTGPTPLIAALRCYVASKLGDEVEIPEELT